MVRKNEHMQYFVTHENIALQVPYILLLLYI